MISRTVEQTLRAAARRSPVVTLTGPRQSGKTTLARRVFRGKAYVSLEAPDVRDFALSDPRGFLREHAAGAVLDEIQRAPELLSYLQGIVDDDPRPGRFVLTGSQNFAMQRGVWQSLAGRTALVTLLPFGREEVARCPAHPTELMHALVTGSYSAVVHRGLTPREWLGEYVATYVERDVRQTLAVSDLGAFQRFLRLAAARSGQLVNFSSLAADAGISHNTASAWLAVLEASYLIVRLPAYHRNVGKRLMKAPKMHFLDSGLLAYLLGIREPSQLAHHPLRGAVFESWVVSEIFKARVHRGENADLCFYRDTHGTEVDAVVETPTRAVLVEAKSGETVAGDAFSSLVRVAETIRSVASPLEPTPYLIYGGSTEQRRTAATVVPWQRIAGVDWTK